MLILDWQRKLVYNPDIAREPCDGCGRRAHARRRSTLLDDEDDATAIEYGLIALRIALACIVAFTLIGLILAGIFDIFRML